MARKFLTPAQLSKIIFNQSSDTGLQQGELIWDSEHLGMMFGLSASTQLEIGQQSVILSYNDTGSTIPAGRAVYGTGATNNRPSISPSTSATAEQSSRTFGVTAEPVPNGGYGWVTTSGILTGIDTSLYVAGDELWLSSSSPGILVTSPIGPPNHDLLVGYCVTSSSVDGAIYLTFNRGVDVSGIHDIVLNSQANNDLIIYNSASNFWVNKQINQVPFNDIPYIDFSTASTVPVADVAKMVWDDGEGTLTFGLKGGNVDLSIGTENVALCYNGTGSPLTDGQVVYISGAQGQRPRISLAQANTESLSSKALGVVTEPIANGAEGFVTTFGIVNGINTSSYTAGDALWLSPTVAGGFTKTKPTSPNHLVFIGYVISVNASSGRIFVNPQNGYELDELHDVAITSKADNDIITYNASSSVWLNQNLNAAILEVDGAGSNIDADLLDGQHGSYYLDWTNVTNKPDPVITLGGDLSGSVTLTDLGSGTLTATIGANSVALGTDTTGNYISQITGTTDQVTVTGSGSESASVTLSLPQSIATSSSPTFAGLTTTSRITTPASVTGTAPLRIPHGTAPSSPVNGDIWTTTAGIYVRVNGSTVGPLGTGGGGTVTVSDTAPVGPSVGDLWYESDTGKLYVYYDSFWVETVGSGGAGGDLSAYLTIASASATYLTQTSASTIYAPLASPTFTGTVTAATLDLTTAATATAATSYWIETGSDGVIRPKTLANTRTEIVTTAAVNSASATILGTVTNGTWNATVIGSTYIDTAIARLASPTFTGTPAAPTAAVNTNTTQIATTAFVVGQGYAKLASPTFTGTPAAPTASVDTNTTQIATTAFVIGQGYLKSATASSTYAPLASPTFTGTPAAPTAAADTNTTQIATTAYVIGQGYLKSSTASTTYAPLASPTFTGTVTAATLDLTTAATVTVATSYWVETGSDGILRPKTLANAQAEIVTTTSVNSASATILGTVTNGTWQGSVISATYIDSAIARLASPALSGTPTAPTASAGTNTTQIATTEFVQTTVNTVTTNTQTASYQLALSDAGKVVEMNVGSGNNLTVPASGTVNFPIGTTIDIVQYGSGQTTIVAAGGVTIRSANSALKLTNQYSAVSLYKRGTDEWVAMGDLTV